MHKIKQLYIHLNKGAILMARIRSLRALFSFPKINIPHWKVGQTPLNKPPPPPCTSSSFLADSYDRHAVLFYCLL